MSDQDGKTLEEMSMEELEARANGEELPVEQKAEEAPKEEQAAEAAGQPEEEVAEAQAEVADTEQAQEEVVQEPESSLPEKYQGKSAEELVKILQDQESYIGKLGNERSTTKREMDELRDRIKNIELTPQSQDPQGDLRQGLEEDPAEALIKYVDNKVNSLENKAIKDAQHKQEMEFETYYNEQMASNPDFLRRRDQMDVIADQVRDYFKPSMVKSKGFIEMVDLLSQAVDMDHYKNEALAAQRQTKENALNEKRQAVTESSYSQGTTSTPVPSEPKAMTMEELEQALKKSLANK